MPDVESERPRWHIRMKRLAYHFLYYALWDIRTGRFMAVLISCISALLPDFLCVSYVRGALWRLAGAKISMSSSSIRSGVFIECPKRLTTGRDLFVNRDSYLDATGGLEIGDNVTIAMGCKVLTMQHAGAVHEREIMAKTVIGSNSIVYAGAIILPGATIEPFVVVAAGAVLRGTTVRGGIYAGSPAQFKGFRKDIPGFQEVS